MADSATHLDLLTPGQLQADVTMNALFRAMSPAMAYSRRERKSEELTWSVMLPRHFNNQDVFGATQFTIAAGATTYITVRLEDNQLNLDTDDTTRWDNQDEFRRLYLIVTDTGGISSYEDHRECRSSNV